MATVCFLTLAGREIGFGHLSRCMNLASAMKAEGHQVSFAVFGLSEAEGHVLREYKVVLGSIDDLFNEHPGLTQSDDNELDCVVVDAAHPILLKKRQACADLFRAIRKRASLVALIDGGGDQSLLQKCPALPVDVAIYPYVGSRPTGTMSGKVLAGAEYAILGPEYASVRAGVVRQGASRVLVSCGGSDPAEVTRKLIHAFLEAQSGLDIRIVIGPLFQPDYAAALRAMIPDGCRRRGR